MQKRLDITDQKLQPKSLQLSKKQLTLLLELADDREAALTLTEFEGFLFGLTDRGADNHHTALTKPFKFLTIKVRK